MFILYGIPNCNTVKKAVDWLKKNDIIYTFHDYKKKGISEQKLQEWTIQVGWERLVNKRGTTWKTLDEALQLNINNTATAIGLMMAKTSVIKRPIIEHGNKIVAVGFDEKEYENVFY
ncbi:MAG: ArsC family reductase [Deinococcales bacterium]|nr:ArsC family reductase [Chitinophagaceae bacterium]